MTLVRVVRLVRVVGLLTVAWRSLKVGRVVRQVMLVSVRVGRSVSLVRVVRLVGHVRVVRGLVRLGRSVRLVMLRRVGRPVSLVRRVWRPVVIRLVRLVKLVRVVRRWTILVERYMYVHEPREGWAW